MKTNLLYVLLQLLFTSSYGQTLKVDTVSSVFTNLTTRKIYSLNFESMTSADSSYYKINDKLVDKRIFDKYHAFSKNMELCTPCILLWYDTTETLLSKGIQYGDCRVGYWIDYYRNGKVKTIGHYKENPPGGFCSENGTWIYYKKDGSIHFYELWKNGVKVKKIIKK